MTVTASVCALTGCGEAARARVTSTEVKVGWTGQTTVTVVVRSLTDPDERGRPYCLQHTHYWVDWGLMSSLPSVDVAGDAR